VEKKISAQPVRSSREKGFSYEWGEESQHFGGVRGKILRDKEKLQEKKLGQKRKKGRWEIGSGKGWCRVEQFKDGGKERRAGREGRERKRRGRVVVEEEGRRGEKRRWGRGGGAG